MNMFKKFIKSLERMENKSILEAVSKGYDMLFENMTKESVHNLIKETLNKKALEEFNEFMYNTENNFFLSLELLFDDERLEGLPHSAIKSIRKLQIKLGLYRPISEEELARTVVSSGRKYDFSMNGVKYTFAKRFAEFEKEVS